LVPLFSGGGDSSVTIAFDVLSSLTLLISFRTDLIKSVLYIILLKAILTIL
jgi:hypothetical protein